MADSHSSASQTGDADSSSGLWPALRKILGLEGARSLREQLEEAIDEHEGENDASGSDSAGTAAGDLSRVERQMLRNLLHFSEHDADDVAVPRGEIIAVEASISWEEMVAAFSEHGHSRMPVYRDTLDSVIGMIHIKDIFPFLANGTPPPADWTTLMRQPLYVPQARGALDVLNDMRASRPSGKSCSSAAVHQPCLASTGRRMASGCRRSVRPVAVADDKPLTVPAVLAAALVACS